MDIKEIIRARAAEIRQVGQSLTDLADRLDSFDVEELIMSRATEVIRRLIDDDKAKTDRVKELEAEAAQTDTLITEAEGILPSVTDTPPTDGVPA